MVNVEHPQTRWISIPEPFEWLLRVKWLPDSRRVAVETMNRMQTELRLYFANVESGQAKRILTESDPGWVNVTDDLYFFTMVSISCGHPSATDTCTCIASRWMASW